MTIDTIEKLRDLCSNARLQLAGDHFLGLRNAEETDKRADQAMLSALRLERFILERTK